MKKKLQSLWKNEFFKTIVIYSGIFLIVSIAMCICFHSNGKGFIWAPDGYKQHLVTLTNYRALILEFLKTGHFNTFFWNIGFGFDMFSNYAYYIIGDPFAYISIFFKQSHIVTLYYLLMFIRMYFIGISFLIYCKYKKFKRFGSLVGCIMYTFCVFSLLCSIRHPYFANMLILLPFLFMATERIILENKHLFYTIMIALLFIMSFYFGYMLSIIIAIYALILIIRHYRKDGIKAIILKLLNVLFYSIIGVLIASFVLLPTVYSFLNSERIPDAVIYPYSLLYYREFFSNLVSVSDTYATSIGVQSVIFITLPIFMISKDKDKTYKKLLIILLIPLLIAQVGSIICGFGFPNNRWSFVIPFILAFMTASVLNEDVVFNKKNIIAILVFIILFMGVNIFLDVDINKLILVELFIFVLLMVLIYLKDMLKEVLYKILFLIIVLVGLIFTIYYTYSVKYYGYTSTFLGSGDFYKRVSTSDLVIENYDDAIEYIKSIDDGYYLISKYPYEYQNLSLLLDYNAMGGFYSITPDGYSIMGKDLLNSQYQISRGLKEFDYRTKIDSLLGVKYLITMYDERAPYGFELINTIGNTKIYKNSNVSNFASLYTNYIKVDDYDKLTPLEKESSLLKVSALEDDIYNKMNKESEIDNYASKIKEIDYKISAKYKILNGKNILIVNKTKNKVVIDVDKVKNSEVYLYIKGLNYNCFTKDEYKNYYLKTNYDNESKINKNRVNNLYKWYSPNYEYRMNVKMGNIESKIIVNDYLTSPYYVKSDEYLFNMGYYKELDGTIEISFEGLGKYSYDDIKVYAVDVDDLEENIDNLNKSNFEVTHYANNIMEGNVNTEESGVLQFATLYNKGFKVYVDGKQVETFKSNKYFLAINIDKGEHDIKLVYETPYRKIGLIVSLVSVLALVTITIIKKKKVKD